MSDSDSFIDEVTEEVRRDRLYGYLRRYGWIAVLLIVAIVGGASWSEYRKAQTEARAQALGDAMLAAMQHDETAARVAALDAIAPGSAGAGAVLRLMTAAQQVAAGEPQAAKGTLDALALNTGVPQIYREIAQFKALTLAGSGMSATDRALALEAMAQPGSRLRLLAQEQLALIEIETGAPEAAIARYQTILSDAEVSADLQQRALQVIVALGGSPRLDGVPGLDAGSAAPEPDGQ